MGTPFLAEVGMKNFSCVHGSKLKNGYRGGDVFGWCSLGEGEGEGGGRKCCI